MSQTPAIAKMLELGYHHHQRGDWAQAEQMYRQVLALEPDRPDVLHLLGVLAYQVGQAATAVAYITQAIAGEPHNPDYHNNLGEAYRSLGQWESAIAHYQQALAGQPHNARTLYNLANALQASGESEAAIAAYQRAVIYAPELAPAWNNLGILLKQRGDLDAAIDAYRQASAADPDYDFARTNLGNALMEKGEVSAAIALHQLEIQRRPHNEIAWNDLGTAWQATGRLEEAIAAYEQAIYYKTDLAIAHFQLGAVRQERGEMEKAVAAYQYALLVRHDWWEARLTLAHCLRDCGRTTEALPEYQRVLLAQPTCLPAIWNVLLLLPVLYESIADIGAWRDRWRVGVEKLEATLVLDTVEARQQAVAAAGSLTNFYLAYQGEDDRVLQQQYGDLLHRVMHAAFENELESENVAVENAAGRQGGGCGKLRVAYVSNHFREHTVAELFSGWLRYHDRDRLEIYTYYTDRRIDEMALQIQQWSDVFHHIPQDLAATRERIRRDRPDILVYTDFGMCALTDCLAAQRLAPVQCLAWGHPVTSGLPTIDYFLSSDLMEPEDGQTHYREALVRLPGTGIAYAQPKLPRARLGRAYFSFPEEATIYLCAQSLYKYLPQHDGIFPAIARQVTNAKFVFLESPNSRQVTNRFWERLQRAFAAYRLDPERHCLFLPRLAHSDFLQVNLLADVFLDSLSWSGGNTAFEAIACNLPIVTLPGQLMRSRHAAAILRALGVTDTIATNETEYIELAIRLGLDLSLRRAIAECMHANHPQLFDDRRSVEALETFFFQVAG